MAIRKNYLQLIFAAMYVLTALSIIIWSLSDGGNHLVYYTFQGNILCLLLMMAEIWYVAKGRKIGKIMSLVEYCSLTVILTIGIVYCTLLSNIFSEKFWMDTQSIFLHFINPILYAVYIFVYRSKNMPAVKKAPWCLLPPLLYFGFIMLRNALLDIRWYPYFFVNVDEIGAIGVLKWAVIISICLLVIGYLTLWLASSLRKKNY